MDEKFKKFTKRSDFVAENGIFEANCKVNDVFQLGKGWLFKPE